MATLGTLITRVQELLSLAGGLGVQTYAQPKIVQYIQMGYTTLSQLRFWDNYTNETSYTLDGTTGKVTTDLTDIIKSFGDIEYVWLSQYDNALPRAPKNRDENTIYYPCIKPSGVVTCPFKIIPVTTTGAVRVRYRTAATLPFTETDEVPIDEELLVRWAAMMYLTNDAANPAMVQTMTALYKERLSKLETIEGQQSKSLYRVNTSVMTGWYDA